MRATGTVAGPAFGIMPSWELVPAERTPMVGATLRLANRVVPVSEIRGFIASDEGGRDVRPAFVVLAVFSAVEIGRAHV